MVGKFHRAADESNVRIVATTCDTSKLAPQQFRGPKFMDTFDNASIGS
jgi:hypothetical protein